MENLDKGFRIKPIREQKKSFARTISQFLSNKNKNQNSFTSSQLGKVKTKRVSPRPKLGMLEPKQFRFVPNWES